MKHKHAELIKAWADGAQIQLRAVPGHGEWQDEPRHLIWEEFAEYRIKPEEKQPVVKYLWVNNNGRIAESYASISEVYSRECPEQWIRLDWSRQEIPE